LVDAGGAKGCRRARVDDGRLGHSWHRARRSTHHVVVSAKRFESLFEFSIFVYFLFSNHALGVRVFETTHATLHAKIITVDGVYMSVGSFNLDYLSTYRNLEVAVCVLDRRVVETLDKQFAIDFKAAREVQLTDIANRSWWQRALDAIAYQIARVFKNLNFRNP
jgi:phosphatidylserine/phosphatidylglycerophosphate/cardiolipin synthase-like enzyme